MAYCHGEMGGGATSRLSPVYFCVGAVEEYLDQSLYMQSSISSGEISTCSVSCLRPRKSSDQRLCKDTCEI